MRGKAVVVWQHRRRQRITPAYAGKSVQFWTCNTFEVGSPPPMRGKEVTAETSTTVSRITPAYAGKSSRHYDQYILKGDHPRLCGEKLMIDLSVSWVRGSPPPMRGKVSSLVFQAAPSRITPAYAGKSWVSFGGSGGAWDHPRLCGEKSVYIPKSDASAGSPPPMRGKAFDHLRRKRHRGSPPPMRGKVVRHTHTQDRFRITPAYAGKSPHISCSVPVYKDHPRLCGEKFCLTLSSVWRAGSPPPMRGKERARNVLKSIIRITPAYAGKSCSSNHVFT